MLKLKRTLSFFRWKALLLSLSALTGCKAEKAGGYREFLYQDVHCALDRDIGYFQVSGIQKWMEKKLPSVPLVDCGDALQGDTIGLCPRGNIQWIL